MSQQSPQTPLQARQSKRRKSLMVQVGVVLVLVLGIWFSWQAANRPSLAVPEQLGTLKLVSSTRGDEAKSQINKLHGVAIHLHEAYIAEYAGAGARVTAWVAQAESGSEAAHLLKRMVDGIRKGNAMFTNLEQQAIEGREVYSVDSSDGKHFFYGADKKMVWLQVATAEPLPLVKTALKTL